jgi:hypothetical protein
MTQAIFVTTAIQALAAALALAGWGIPSFPADLNKRPLAARGFKDASAKQAVVRDLWRRRPGLLVGAATGEPSGIDVLDLDRQHGAAAWWTANRHRIPTTRAHRTRSGGLHLLFRHHPGLKCSTAKVGPGVDIKAEGGCIIWWPAAGLPVMADVSVADLAEWPQWLLDAAMPPPKALPIYRPARTFPTAAAAERYAMAALRRAADPVARAPVGSRNSTLNAEVFALSRFIGDKSLGAESIADALAVAALAAGLDQREIIGTIASGLRCAGGRA